MNKETILRRAFHGFSDEQWEEEKNKFPFNEIPYIMKEVARLAWITAVDYTRISSNYQVQPSAEESFLNYYTSVIDPGKPVEGT